MNSYVIYIKSHADSPDYEDDCRAKDIIEASEIFAMKLANLEDNWNSKDLVKFIMEEPA